MNNSVSILDFLTIVSFVVGLANYEENVDQNTMQEAVQSAVRQVHEHLEAQDKKIDKILKALNIEG